jgi:hypothetical protein
MVVMMIIQLQWSFFLLRISGNAKLTVLVSCADANSLLHWFQTPLCVRHVLELVTIKLWLTRKCIDSWYISLEGCQLIIRNPLSCSEGGSMNITSVKWRLVVWWIGTDFSVERTSSIFSVDISLPLDFKARHHRFYWSMAKEMIPAWKWACQRCCVGVNDCYWWARQAVLLLHTDWKRQAFRISCSERWHCANAFGVGSIKSYSPQRLAHAHLPHS